MGDEPEKKGGTIRGREHRGEKKKGGQEGHVPPPCQMGEGESETWGTQTVKNETETKQSREN